MDAKINLLDDIYYSDEYISLYLKEGEELFSFEYKKDNKIFINKTIKRPILKVGNTNISDGLYDLETAYGYGGFYTNTEDEEFIKNAMMKYEEKCIKENVIAEFIRFHPFNNFPLVCSGFLDFNVHDRDVVIKKLSNDILSSYTSKVRNTIKRATEGVLFQESKDIDKFIEIYDATMKKNNASDFYFFKKEFYKKLISIENIKLYEIIFENEVVSMGFFIFSSELGHYHLSANTSISYKLNSNYALLDNVFNIAKKLNTKYFILGGGSTAEEKDSLLRFKKKFSKEVKPFYISGKIYNKEIYDKYSKIWQEQTKKNVKYFLKYRLEIKN